MSKNEDANNDHLTDMEKWMESFFLDPLTSYLDQMMFRIDLYETENEIIVEALLTDFYPADITIYLKEDQLIIKALKKVHLTDESPFKIRKVDFPFLIIQKEVKALFENGILEILISKNKKGIGKNRSVSLP
ncbi:Hsp20 family protein [Bacillus sp. FJAT-29790]|uniref:Hsp20/alpha crystallin family protein n=1 Tax=Bacillus sp. FJAT-29790 TaxID=1895002 RepID=UPI001C2264F8|nr:Hsp20 family protein [Bacillus sp. FJAT-29790]MBU8878325.1 Hsp20 family protein [Bacillus sp. FJAT-29790]